MASDEDRPDELKQLFLFGAADDGRLAYTFKCDDGSTPLIIRQDGKFIVHGRLVEEDEDVFYGFCEWLNRVLGEETVRLPRRPPRLKLVTTPPSTRLEGKVIDFPGPRDPRKT